MQNIEWIVNIIINKNEPTQKCDDKLQLKYVVNVKLYLSLFVYY